jgi:glutamyl-tRNA synthetase
MLFKVFYRLILKVLFMLSGNSIRIIENIIIKYRCNCGEIQDPKKMFSVAMGSKVKEELVRDVKGSIESITKITEDVNSWTEKKVIEEFDGRGLEEEKIKIKKTLVFPKMENIIEGKVITAVPPEPSKQPHIGHAYAAYINYLFAKEHKGKFYLRFEDTNPVLAKKEYYKIILDELKWLKIVPDKIIYASDNIDLLYEKVEELIKIDKAYVCNCKSELVRDLRQKMKECSCRERNIDENLNEWKKMLAGDYAQGEISLRLKGFMDSPKAEFRDPVLMRINNTKHPRTGTKYCVWPSYVLQSTVFDDFNKVTHRFRSKEFEPWKLVQKHLAKLLNLKYPNMFEFARVNLEGSRSSGREIREIAEEKGWDHPALTTLSALRRRGFLSETIISFIEKMGISKTESTIEWTVFEKINRKLLSDMDVFKADYFENPLEVDLYKDNKKIKSGFIEKSFEENKEARIRHLGNVIRKKNKLEFTSEDPKKGLSILSFAEEIEKITVLMPDFENDVKIGFMDKQVTAGIKEGDYVFFLGFGFCILESKKDLVFVFSHN